MSARVVVVAPVDVAARLAAALGGAGLPVEGCGPDPATVPPRGDVVAVVDVGLDDAAPVGAPPVVDTVLEAAPGAAVLAVAADVVPGQVLAALRAGRRGSCAATPTGSPWPTRSAGSPPVTSSSAPVSPISSSTPTARARPPGPWCSPSARPTSCGSSWTA
ncbi:hypothetical protein ACFQV8_28485 [Pseudonocardia benzenivorans]